ncbi:hypothetical protein [Oceanobacillus sp. Castelsardo]|uniref:hypothetical protein n=1 Tax=Oceanobacillus sp. Castelsardo TaxID=1851204 RepID=UPI0008399BE7|nr:hypothetical protein [Oceanobacillus sp. Castelsardo]
MGTSDKEYILQSIPSREKETYYRLTKLSLREKHLMWKLIRNTNIEGITIYQGSIENVHRLLLLELVATNPLYKTKEGEISLFILRDTPYLLRLLRKIARGNREKSIRKNDKENV